MGNGDNFALDWIKGELESTLDQARAALESYAEGGREETRLRSCLTSLHQVHGTLRMLELEGVVLLADHMEQAAQSLLNGSIQDARAAEQSLMQCILQLPAFIEEVQNGVTEDLPLVMPFVNELRACCGLSPMQLTPQVSAEFTTEQAADAMRRFRGISGADKAARVRSAYQQVLLSVLKGAASKQTVDTLEKIAIGMQRICEGAPLVTLWKALEFFAKGYASDPQKMSSEAIRDLRRVDAEMKKIAADGAEVLVEPLPVELVRDLLRTAEAHGQRDEQITELRSLVQAPQAPELRPREALDQAAEVLSEEIAAVRDHFDLFARGADKSLAELQELTVPLESICSTLSMLGDSHGADLLRGQRALVLSLAQDSDVTEEVILGVAGALVQTEQALSGQGEIASSDEALANAALNDAQVAVLQEARGGIDQVKQSIVDFVSSKWNTGYLDDAPGVLVAVEGALTMIPLRRAAQLLEQCTGYINEQLLQGHHPDWQELDAFADALGGIDYFLERLSETGRVPGDDALDLTEQSLQRLVARDADDSMNAMVGASPEELGFSSETDAELDPDSEQEQESPFGLVPLDADDEQTADTNESSAVLEPVAETEAVADAVASADAVADEEAVSDIEFDSEPDTESDTKDVDLTQTSFVDTSISEQPTSESISFGKGDSPELGAGQDSGLGAAAAAAGLGAAGAIGVGAISEGAASSGPAVFTLPSDDSAVPREEPVAEVEAEPEPETPAVDPEIVEVFVEEVDEILEAIEVQLPEWSEDLTNVAPITEIRRNFHTLKGSGRIVGANQIGELGWAVENMLNRLMDGTIAPSEDHLFIVSHAIRIAPKLRADFTEGNTAEDADLVELLEQVDVLASGGALSSALASSHSLEAASSVRPPSVDVPSFFADQDDSQASVTEDSRAIFAEELQEHIDILSERVRNSLADDELELDSPFTRSLHTIAGSAATAGQFAVVGIVEPIQDVSSVVLRERNGVLDGEYLAFVREGVYALQRLLDVDAQGGTVTDDESTMFAAEAERLLGGLLEAPDAPTSLLELDDTTALLDAREYLDAWRFGALDLERAEQMNRALVTAIDRAHSDDFAELAEVLHLAHNQFGDQPLSEERHYALVAAHDDVLTQLDALAAGQVANVTLESRERLQDLIGQSSPPEAQASHGSPEINSEAEEEPLDDDAQEALAYTLDKSDAFDLDALDDDMFGASDAEQQPEQQPEQRPEQQEEVVEPPSVQPTNTPVTEIAGAAATAAAAAVAVGSQAASQDEEPTSLPNASKDESDDDVDPEILEIFFEESDELLEEFDHNLQSWSEDRANPAPLGNLLRGLHTLKGGARLAGLSALGDMTHDYESELIEIQNLSADVSDAQFETVQQRYDDLVEAVARARDGDISTPDTAPDTAPELAENADVEELAQQESAQQESTQEQPASSTVEPNNDFEDDVAAAFSPEAIAEVDAEVEREQELRVQANEASIASLNAGASSSAAADEVVEVVPLTTTNDGLDTPAPRAPETVEHAASVEVSSSADDDRSRNAQEMVRVSATLLEDLVNLAGESSIVRARVEQGISDFGGALEEMETTIERLREQLRQLEIETEARVSSRVERAQSPAYEDFDPLEMDRYSQLQQLTRSLTESATDMMDLKETLRYRARESETLLLQQARLNTELQEGLMRTRMVPFSRLMPRLRRIVRQVSRDLDKQVEFQAYNAEGELDRNVLERMVPPLEHMLRNAIDHGIESEDLRQNFGKPNIGRIGLKLSREGGDVVIEISDDGAGIDVESVRAKAVERGLMAADAALTDDEVLDFVLAPGFSTAQSLTQISGRGVGMDVVHSEVKQLGGSIEIGSVPGRGTTFTVRLPFTVSVNRALMVMLGDDQYAIPLNTIEGIVLIPSEDLSRHYGPQGVPFEYAGVPYQVRYLGSYLSREYVARGEQTSVPVVLVRSGDQAVAVHVDDVQGSREIVVKSLGPQFAGVGGISGATILGDGSVVIILDLLSLMRARGPAKHVDSRLPSSAEEERLVLVVDDSVTVRKVTSRLLERQGMSVLTAKDGVEAISVLQERLPDVILLDIEMPRMDGFEVAHQVRRDERLAELPIVMISSRTGEKHTQRARELGVNRFLGKPFQENELLETIDELVTRS